MTTVLVCDDAPLAREAIRRAVGAVPGVERVTAAGSGEEVLARFPIERPDLVLMDVRMPGIGGVEASRRLVAAHPEATVVMLTMGEDPDGVARAVSGGARGYVAKDASREEVAATVALALAAGREGPASRSPRVRPAGSPPALTEREQQVLDGMSPRQVQRRDRPRALPVRGHRQDPRPPPVPQARRRRPRAGRRPRLPLGLPALIGGRRRFWPAAYAG